VGRVVTGGIYLVVGLVVTGGTYLVVSLVVIGRWVVVNRVVGNVTIMLD